jgi:hypothetical protein
VQGGDDQLLKEIITAFPGDFIALAAPDLAAQVRLDEIEFRQEEYFTDSPRGGRPRRPDLAATVPVLADGESPVVFHVEIESRYRSGQQPRLLEYNQVLGIRHGKVAHTLVLYRRGGPGGANKAVYEVRSLGRTVTRFEYSTLGLTKAQAITYLALENPLAWAFAALMRPGELGSRARLRLACLRRIAGARDLDEARRFLLFNFVHNYIESDQDAATEYQALMRMPRNKEVREMMMTLAQRIEKATQEGRQEGRQEERQSNVATLREFVLRLAAKRFGRASRGLERRIAKVDSVQELLRLAETIPAADSPDALATREATA